MSEQQPPGSQPRYSDDGRFWWDGTRWNPVQAPPAPAPSASVSVKSGNPFTAGMMGCLGVGCAVLLVFGVLFAACSGIIAGVGNSVVSSPAP